MMFAPPCPQIAGQVLGEDLVLVLGQQERMIAGDDTWCTPMPYDKLAVRYRRWRNMVRSSRCQDWMSRPVAHPVGLGYGSLVNDWRKCCTGRSVGCIMYVHSELGGGTVCDAFFIALKLCC